MTTKAIGDGLTNLVPKIQTTHQFPITVSGGTSHSAMIQAVGNLNTQSLVQLKGVADVGPRLSQLVAKHGMPAFNQLLTVTSQSLNLLGTVVWLPIVALGMQMFGKQLEELLDGLLVPFNIAGRKIQDGLIVYMNDLDKAACEFHKCKMVLKTDEERTRCQEVVVKGHCSGYERCRELLEYRIWMNIMADILRKAEQEERWWLMLKFPNPVVAFSELSLTVIGVFKTAVTGAVKGFGSLGTFFVSTATMISESLGMGGFVDAAAAAASHLFKCIAHFARQVVGALAGLVYNMRMLAARWWTYDWKDAVLRSWECFTKGYEKGEGRYIRTIVRPCLAVVRNQLSSFTRDVVWLNVQPRLSLFSTALYESEEKYWICEHAARSFAERRVRADATEHDILNEMLVLFRTDEHVKQTCAEMAESMCQETARRSRYETKTVEICLKDFNMEMTKRFTTNAHWDSRLTFENTSFSINFDWMEHDPDPSPRTEL